MHPPSSHGNAITDDCGRVGMYVSWSRKQESNLHERVPKTRALPIGFSSRIGLASSFDFAQAIRSSPDNLVLMGINYVS